MEIKKIIVGLGNPGDTYVGTRHNIGRDCIQKLHANGGFSSWRTDKRLQADVAVGNGVVLALPNTFMNRSGESVAQLMKEYPGAKLVVVHDDLDLPVGEYKVSQSKGSGGHNGVQSIIDQIKTNDFTRFRIGITPLTFFGTPKKPKGEERVSRFVLGKFTRREMGKVAPVLEELEREVI